MIPENPFEKVLRLTAREHEVLRELATGATTTEIAQKLGLSPKTLDSHYGRLQGKLELKNSPQLRCFAVRYTTHLEQQNLRRVPLPRDVKFRFETVAIPS